MFREPAYFKIIFDFSICKCLFCRTRCFITFKVGCCLFLRDIILAEVRTVYGFARIVPARWTSSGQGVVLARHQQLRACTVAWVDGHISVLRSPVPGYDAIAYFYSNHLKQFRNFRPQD